MTVLELIEKLKEFDETLQVVLSTPESEYEIDYLNKDEDIVYINSKI